MPYWPHAAKGMQFVNIDSLVDLYDLEDFKKQYSEEIEGEFDQRFLFL